MPATLILAALLASAQPTADTLHLEVGAREIDARVYRPHRARVRVHTDGPSGPVTNEWVNELTLGDSAGRPVMRWITTSMIGPQRGSTLRQTYDGITMAPIAYLSEQSSGAVTQFRIEGRRVVGWRRTASDTTRRPIDLTLDRLGFIASASDLIPLAVGMRRGRVITAPVWGPNMASAEQRIFTVVDRVPAMVEGVEWAAWKVEERRASDRTLMATWYLTDESPYMVAGEMLRPDGGYSYASEVALPPEAPRAQPQASADARQPASRPVTPREFAQVRWLDGSWRGAGTRPGSDFYESFAFVNDSTVQRYTYTDSTLTATSESSRMELRERVLRQVRPDGQPRSVIVQLSPDTLRFAPLAPGGNHVLWVRRTDDHWSVAFGPPGQERLVYEMRRYRATSRQLPRTVPKSSPRASIGGHSHSPSA